VIVSPFAAKENTMKLRLSASAERDERVALMLDKHVRDQHGAALIQTTQQRPLKRRLELALSRA
jgi:hypothetical protein